MHLHCLGLNHRTTPITLRERLALDSAQRRAMLARCGCKVPNSSGSLSEIVVLSTCNRIELYVLSPSADPNPLKDLLAEASDVPRPKLSPHLYHMLDQNAVDHLLRVAAGLDSMVLGEPQILGQVADAYTESLRLGAVGPVLSRLFQTAIHGGKRARHETAIGRNPATISSVAVHLMAEVFEDLAGAHVVVMGAGEMGKLAVEALRKRGVAEICVINRTVARARAFADRWQARARPFEALDEELLWADILITSTGAPHPLLTRQRVARAMQGRQSRPMIIMDIALPRDVEPEVASVPGVQLYDLDDLQHRLHKTLGRRQSEVPRVEAILQQESQNFMSWFEALDVRPLIIALQQQAERIRRKEMERTLRRLPDISQEQVQQIETLTRSLVKKLLGPPTARLRAEALNGHGAEFAIVAQKLFGLDGIPARADTEKIHPSRKA